MRKLVTVRKILELKPIEGADFIELAIIDGWQCVVKKGEFEQGDYCLYFEIDSYLPIEERYEFLRKSCYRNVRDWRDGFRIKTMKLKGVLSQGLAIPVFGDINPEDAYVNEHDLTEQLGVVLYDPPLPLSMCGVARGHFPSWLSKSSQERIQNFRDIDSFKDKTFEVTLKLDGSSMTVYNNVDEEGNNVIGVCSTNFDLKLDQEGNNFITGSQQSGAIEFITTRVGYALQGELIGGNIQGNPEGLNGLAYYIFDVWNITEQRYLTPKERFEFLEGSGLKHCPVLFDNFNFPNDATLEDIRKICLDLADDTKSLSGKQAEGVVFKANDGSFSFKSVSNIWLSIIEK